LRSVSAWLRPEPCDLPHQERWKDTPPAAERKPGEIAVREVSQKKKAQAEHEAAERADVLAKLRAA
jgi:hypothetical protein